LNFLLVATFTFYNLYRVPVSEKFPKSVYEKTLLKLQAELVNLQEWTKVEGKRIVVIFEGRDAAGKGSTIKRFTQYLNPRLAQIVALPAPTEREVSEWYFQRYVSHLPTNGEMKFFDRSWYNRAGVEKVMGYCTPDEHRRFLHQAPIFERMLIEDGIILRKYWFSISDSEQTKRFESRLKDPMRRWKFSPTDMDSVMKWEEYSKAKDEMFVHTDLPESPWFVVEAEDKRIARLNAIHHFLSTIDYTTPEVEALALPKRPKASELERPPRELNHYVPDFANTLLKD
jgi:polyphosphate kinase 2